jgi:hypothetical protein
MCGFINYGASPLKIPAPKLGIDAHTSFRQNLQRLFMNPAAFIIRQDP